MWVGALIACTYRLKTNKYSINTPFMDKKNVIR